MQYEWDSKFKSVQMVENFARNMCPSSQDPRLSPQETQKIWDTVQDPRAQDITFRGRTLAMKEKTAPRGFNPELIARNHPGA